MKLIKPSSGLVLEFKAVLARLPSALPRKMFGYDAAFVNGNMAVGLWQNTCVVKVSEADRAALIEQGLAVPFAPMKGRVMTGWVELSEELANDPEELLKWSERAVAHVGTLPPKSKSIAVRRKATKAVTGSRRPTKTNTKRKA